MIDPASGSKLSAPREPSAAASSDPPDFNPLMALGLAGNFVVFILTAVALSAAVNNLRAGSVSFTAGMAALSGVISWSLVLLYRSVPMPAARVAGIFMTFLAWAFGLSLIDGITRQGLQFLMVQVAFLGALVLASTARFIIGHRLDLVVARCFRVTSCALIASVLLSAAHIANIGGDRSSVIVALVGLGWFLAEYRLGNRKALWWASGIVIAIGISLSRSALFAAFALVVFTLLSTSRKHLGRSVLLVVILSSTGYWAITYWAPLRDRFTQGDTSLSVAGINVNAEGRTKIWGVLWSEAQQEIVIGRGSGAASARSFSLSPAFGHPHNDYLRILYDFGAVGVGLLVWFSIRSARLLRRIRKRSLYSVPALAALNAVVGVLIVMVTDNPLDYAFVMIPLGALVGLGLGSYQPRTAKPRHVRKLAGAQSLPNRSPGGTPEPPVSRAGPK